MIVPSYKGIKLEDGEYILFISKVVVAGDFSELLTRQVNVTIEDHVPGELFEMAIAMETGEKVTGVLKGWYAQ